MNIDDITRRVVTSCNENPEAWRQAMTAICGRVGPKAAGPKVIFTRLLATVRAIVQRWGGIGRTAFSMSESDSREILLLAALLHRPEFDGASLGPAQAWGSADNESVLSAGRGAVSAAFGAHPHDREEQWPPLVVEAFKALSGASPGWESAAVMPGDLISHESAAEIVGCDARTIQRRIDGRALVGYGQFRQVSRAEVETKRGSLVKRRARKASGNRRRTDTARTKPDRS